MFTTECPKCGREIDVGETECPYCTAGAETPTAGPPEPAPVPAAQRPPQRRPVQRARRVPRKPAPWSIPPLYLAIVAGFLVGTIGVVVYLTSPGLFTGSPKLKLENVAESEDSGGGTASVGDLEVTGVRAWWDQESEKLKVRAVVVNHGEVSTNLVNLKVHLKSKKSRASASPLASFDIRLDEELGPLQSRDIEAELASLAHPSALPPWNEIRIELDEQ